MFKIALILALAVCSLGFVNGGMVGQVTIVEGGQSVTRYVVSTWPGGAQAYGSTIQLQHGAQIQIASTSSDNYSPYMFMEYKLKGKTLSFTADLSSIGCSCNAAFYLVTMPGYGSNWQPNPGQGGDYYCDANDVNGEWCWELDIMEANKYVTEATPHQCYQPPGGYITSCDQGGCGTNSHNVNSQGMCPDSSCTINTAQPFRQAMTFGSTMHVNLTQNGRSFSFNSCDNSGYVSAMDEALNYGMVIVMSYWGSDWNTMSWLDGNTGCQGNCDTSGTAKFSDIVIT